MKLQIALLALCGFVFGVQGETSPVFLWGVDSPAYPSLKTISQSDFSELAASYLDDKMVVVFMENGLSNKDFSCSKSKTTSESCYAQLQGVSPKTYYASVENPIEAISSVAQNQEDNSVDKSGRLSNPLECAPGKVVYVSFSDLSNKDRASTLEAHDAAIAAISREISCSAVFVYTTAPGSSVFKSRSRRDTTNQVIGTYFRQGNNFLVFFTKALYFNGDVNNPSTTELAFTGSTLTNNTNANGFTFNMTGTGIERFGFEITYSGGYYTMGTVYYNNQKYRASDINAPFDFSFSCGNLILPIINDDPNATPSSAYLQFNSFQMQAPNNPNTQLTFVFGDSWDCLSFFSPGILMGLLVVALMLSITFIGACWMMDINTMDRFDDPKGKTITINASE